MKARPSSATWRKLDGRADGLLHGHDRVYRLQGLRGRVQGMEPASGQRRGCAHAVPGERGRTPGAGRKLVPFLARDLAGLAADTHGRVREEAHRLGHQAFSTLQTKALPSWIVTFGSPTSDVSSFTMSPVTNPS